MNIKFTLHWLNKEDLKNKDASLSLGWIEMQTKNYKLSLFKKNLCMVFVTITDLLDFFLSEKKEFNWIGVDGGERYKLTRKDSGLLYLNFEHTNYTIDYISFRESLIFTVDEFVSYFEKINSNIRYEAAFIDLNYTLNLLKQLDDNNQAKP